MINLHICKDELDATTTTGAHPTKFAHLQRWIGCAHHGCHHSRCPPHQMCHHSENAGRSATGTDKETVPRDFLNIFSAINLTNMKILHVFFAKFYIFYLENLHFEQCFFSSFSHLYFMKRMLIFFFVFRLRVGRDSPTLSMPEYGDSQIFIKMSLNRWWNLFKKQSHFLDMERKKFAKNFINGNLCGVQHFEFLSHFCKNEI